MARGRGAYDRLPCGELPIERFLVITRSYLENIEFVVCSMAFDGIEGNSPAAGATVYLDPAYLDLFHCSLTFWAILRSLNNRAAKMTC